MQHLLDQTNQTRGGGRIASPDYRQSLRQHEEFTGLDENCDRYGLLLLCKRVGRLVGFTPRMIQLLEYYMAFTRGCDWEEGSHPIVYQSLVRTARDMCVTERQIQNLEQQLFRVGAITWNDSGNHKRYGQRDPKTGEILYAYGVDLTPLAYLKPALEDKLQQKQIHDQAWQNTKREISWYRSQIRGLLLELQEEGIAPNAVMCFANSYHDIAIQIRTHINLADLKKLRERHQLLHGKILHAVEFNSIEQNSDTRAFKQDGAVDNNVKKHKILRPAANRNYAHKQYKTQEINKLSSPPDQCFQENAGQSSEPNNPVLATGVQHVSPKQVFQAASDRFRQRLPIRPRPLSWEDVVEAAYQLRPELHVSQNSWGEACQTLGRYGASLCLLITDRAMQRPNDPVRSPAAYFHGMVKQGRVGQLRLHNSIFALIERSGVHGGRDA